MFRIVAISLSLLSLSLLLSSSFIIDDNRRIPIKNSGGGYMVLAFQGPGMMTCRRSSGCGRTAAAFSFGHTHWMAVSDENGSSPSLEEQVYQLTQILNNVTAELTNVQKKFAKQDEINAELTKNNAELTKNNTELTVRIDGIVSAFAPATLFALLETAVYKFMSNENEHVCYATARLMQIILSMLVKNDEQNKPKKLKLEPSPTMVPEGISNENKVQCIREGLAALTVFIDQKEVTQQDLQGWPPARGPLAHDGRFIAALYGPEQDQEQPSHLSRTLSRQAVLSMRANFEERRPTGTHGGELSNPLEALGEVVAALQSKNITVTTAAHTDAKTKLKDLCATMGYVEEHA